MFQSRSLLNEQHHNSPDRTVWTIVFQLKLSHSWSQFAPQLGLQISPDLCFWADELDREKFYKKFIYFEASEPKIKNIEFLQEIKRVVLLGCNNIKKIYKEELGEKKDK